MRTTNFICSNAPCLQKAWSRSPLPFYLVFCRSFPFPWVMQQSMFPNFGRSQLFFGWLSFCQRVSMQAIYYFSTPALTVPFMHTIIAAIVNCMSHLNTTNPPHSSVKNLLLLFLFCEYSYTFIWVTLPCN